MLPCLALPQGYKVCRYFTGVFKFELEMMWRCWLLTRFFCFKLRSASTVSLLSKSKMFAHLKSNLECQAWIKSSVVAGLKPGRVKLIMLLMHKHVIPDHLFPLLWLSSAFSLFLFIPPPCLLSHFLIGARPPLLIILWNDNPIVGQMDLLLCMLLFISGREVSLYQVLSVPLPPHKHIELVIAVYFESLQSERKSRYSFSMLQLESFRYLVSQGLYYLWFSTISREWV